MKTARGQSLKGMNTFGMDVSCRCMVEYSSVAELLELDFEDLPRPLLHIGAGSNLLFTRDFPGTVLHSAIDFIEILEDDGERVLVSVGGGTVFDNFCIWAAGEGLWGPENLSGIPGEVGASAVQNVGAYGVEAKDLIREVFCYDLDEEEFVRFDVSECGYGYRDSVFKHEGVKGRYIVTHVVFSLTRKYSPVLSYGHLREILLPEGKAEGSENPGAAGSPLTPSKVREAIIAIRGEKLPDPARTGSAGSFFRNPVVGAEVYGRIAAEAEREGRTVPHYDLPDGTVKIPAAWLIEQCGWKGRRSGNAGVWERQPLVIVNATGQALPEEILSLENRIRISVRERFGISLEPEVEHI